MNCIIEMNNPKRWKGFPRMTNSTVEQALDAYKKARTAWYEFPTHADDEEIITMHVAMDEALDVLIAAVRASSTKSQCDNAICLEQKVIQNLQEYLHQRETE